MKIDKIYNLLMIERKIGKDVSNSVLENNLWIDNAEIISMDLPMFQYFLLLRWNLFHLLMISIAYSRKSQ